MTFLEATRLNDSYPKFGIWFKNVQRKKIDRTPEAVNYSKYDYGQGQLVGYFHQQYTSNLKEDNIPLLLLITNQFKNKDGVYIIRLSVEVNSEIYCVFIKSGVAQIGSDRVYHEEDLEEIVELIQIDEIYDITHESIFE